MTRDDEYRESMEFARGLLWGLLLSGGTVVLAVAVLYLALLAR